MGTYAARLNVVLWLRQSPDIFFTHRLCCRTDFKLVIGRDQDSHSLQLAFPSHSEYQEMWLETKNKNVLDA